MALTGKRAATAARAEPAVLTVRPGPMAHREQTTGSASEDILPSPDPARRRHHQPSAIRRWDAITNIQLWQSIKNEEESISLGDSHFH